MWDRPWRVPQRSVIGWLSFIILGIWTWEPMGRLIYAVLYSPCPHNTETKLYRVTSLQRPILKSPLFNTWFLNVYFKPDMDFMSVHKVECFCSRRDIWLLVRKTRKLNQQTYKCDCLVPNTIGRSSHIQAMQEMKACAWVANLTGPLRGAGVCSEARMGTRESTSWDLICCWGLRKGN